jgi:hypothetical protein
MLGVKQNPHLERYFKRYDAKVCEVLAIVLHHNLLSRTADKKSTREI